MQKGILFFQHERFIFFLPFLVKPNGAANIFIHCRSFVFFGRLYQLLFPLLVFFYVF